MLPATARKNFHRKQSSGKISTGDNRPVKFTQESNSPPNSNPTGQSVPVPVMFQPVPCFPIRGENRAITK